MDPPPQAHIGVGHDPEYSMPPNSGQPSVTPWTEGVEARGRRAPAAFGEQARRGGVASEGMRSARPESPAGHWVGSRGVACGALGWLTRRSPAGHWVGSRGVACGALGWLTRSRLRGTGLAQAESPAGHWVGTRGVACEAWGRRGREPPPQGAFRACSGRVRGVGAGRAAAQIGGRAGAEFRVCDQRLPDRSPCCAPGACGSRPGCTVGVVGVAGARCAFDAGRPPSPRAWSAWPDRSPCCVPGACGSRPGCSVGVVGVAGARCAFRAGRPLSPRAWSACVGSEPVLCTPVRVGVVPGAASAPWESRVRGVRSVRVGLPFPRARSACAGSCLCRRSLLLLLSLHPLIAPPLAPLLVFLLLLRPHRAAQCSLGRRVQVGRADAAERSDQVAVGAYEAARCAPARPGSSRRPAVPRGAAARSRPPRAGASRRRTSSACAPRHPYRAR